MRTHISKKLLATRISAIVTIAMLFNIFAPIVDIMPLRAAGSGYVDVSGYLTTQTTVTNASGTVNPLGMLDIFLEFNIPSDETFNAEKPYLYYPLRSITAQENVAGSSPNNAIDYSQFASSTLSGYMQFEGSIYDEDSNAYPYWVETNSDSPYYGCIIADMRKAFDADGNLIDENIYESGKTGWWKVSLGIDASAFQDEESQYTFYFSSSVTATPITVTDKPYNNRGLSTTKNFTSIDLDAGTVSYTISF